MTAWDVEETVEELQPFIEFERNEGGQFQFGCVYGEMDCRFTERDGKRLPSSPGKATTRMSKCSGVAGQSLKATSLMG